MKAKWEILLLLIGFVILLLFVVLIAALIGWSIVGGETNLSEAVFDFWSLGHLLAGMGIYMFIFTVYFVVKNVIDEPGEPPGIETPSAKNIRISWLITLGAAILWEILENTLLYALGIKAKFDSIINASSDIIIWGIGGLGAWYLTHLMFVSKDNVHAYYLFAIINIAAFFVVFILFGYMTFNL